MPLSSIMPVGVVGEADEAGDVVSIRIVGLWSGGRV
jgi:hypothetical protein